MIIYAKWELEKDEGYVISPISMLATLLILKSILHCEFSFFRCKHCSTRKCCIILASMGDQV